MDPVSARCGSYTKWDVQCTESAVYRVSNRFPKYIPYFCCARHLSRAVQFMAQNTNSEGNTDSVVLVLCLNAD